MNCGKIYMILSPNDSIHVSLAVTNIVPLAPSH